MQVRSALRDPWSTLGVPHNATEKEVKKAHRQLVKQHHPDVKSADPLAYAHFIRIQVRQETRHPTPPAFLPAASVYRCIAADTVVQPASNSLAMQQRLITHQKLFKQRTGLQLPASLPCP